MDDELDERALELPRPLDKPDIAERLELATSNQAVWVDKRGRVRSPTWGKVMVGGSYAILGTALAGSLVAYYWLLGPIGVGILSVVMLPAARNIRAGVRLRKSVALVLADRFDEALEQVDPVANGRFYPRLLKANAHRIASGCHAALGQHEMALERVRTAIEMYGRKRRTEYWLARYAEASCLAVLGRVEEAREVANDLGSSPEGDYLLMTYQTTMLHVTFAEGHHRIPEDDLFEQAHRALEIPSASALLGLLAWAYVEIGDDDMADHLLDEAFDRHPGPRLANGMPKLEAWMQARLEARK